MKSRSELVAERQAKEKKKASASGSVNLDTGTVHCNECDEDYDVSKLTKRDDGRFECGGCAMPLTLERMPKTKASAKDEKPAKKKDENSDASKETPSENYCGECGSKWPLVDGRVWKNCGHANAHRVDDPRKANKMRDVGPSGVTVPPEGSASMPVMPPNARVEIDDNRMTMYWGKMTFPIGEILGISKFSNMDVGPFVLSERVEKWDVATTRAVMKRLLAMLQEMADMAFESQLVWYKQKLGLIK